jgi:cytochrome c553
MVAPKSLFLSLAISISILIISACANDKYDDQPEPEPQAPCTTCTPEEITYSNTVAGLLDRSCTNCHGGSFPSGGVSLNSYAQAKSNGESGALLGTIKHQSPFSPMPQGSNKWSDADIAKIEAWINNGYPQ